MEKFYQMNLHLLHHKREERLGLADYEPDFSIRPEQVDYVNCTKYLDAFALLYNLDIEDFRMKIFIQCCQMNGSWNYA